MHCVMRNGAPLHHVLANTSRHESRSSMIMSMNKSRDIAAEVAAGDASFRGFMDR
jgi:hypothetical protein